MLPGSPYAHIFLKVFATLKPDYPSTVMENLVSAPSLKFNPPIYHPNVSTATGRICVNSIGDNWLPGNTLVEVMNTVSALLFDPNANSPLNSEASILFTKDLKEYNKKARADALQKYGYTVPNW
jgi:ubiquitin-protein ligase